VTTAASLADRLAAPRVWRSIGIALFLLVAFVPLLAIGLAALKWLAESPAAAALVTPLGRRLPILLRSLLRSGLVAGAAMGLGLVVASAYWRAGPRWFLRTKWLFVALAPVPAYIHALAWTTFATELARRLRPLVGPGLAFVGPGAAGWVSVMSLLPLALALALLATGGVPRLLREMAQVYQPDGRVLLRVVLPLAAPLLAMGACVLFLLDLLDYSVPSLFQVNVYALEVFVAFSESNEPAEAFVAALPLLLVSLAVVVLIARHLPRAMQAPAHAGLATGWRARWPLPFRLAQGLAVGVMLLAALVPLVSLAALVGDLGSFGAAIGAARADVVYSLAVALVAAVAVLPLGLAAAGWLGRGGPDGRGSRLAWLAVCLPLAVPPSLVGIGLIVAFNTPLLPLHGTNVMPVLAALARFAPLVALVLYAQRRRLDPLLLDAGRLFQRSYWRGWTGVTLPLMAPGLAAGACLTFALTLGELGATLLVAPAGRETLTMRIYNFLHSGASDRVAALCLVMVLAALAAGGLALVALAAMDRAGRGGAARAEAEHLAAAGEAG
jgi:iron(III) transport system permease protein